MVPQERDLITTLLTRLKSAGGQPKDPEADALIRQAMTEQPDAPYYLVQTVLIQDLSLQHAQNRIAELEKQVADAQPPRNPRHELPRRVARPQPAGAAARRRARPVDSRHRKSPRRRLRLCAAAAIRAAAGLCAQQGYAQQGPHGGGMFGGGGSGFLRSAAATAAGVAGGALLFQGISSHVRPQLCQRPWRLRRDGRHGHRAASARP